MLPTSSRYPERHLCISAADQTLLTMCLCNVADYVFMQMQDAVRQAEASFGACDIMICNAGATEPGIARVSAQTSRKQHCHMAAHCHITASCTTCLYAGRIEDLPPSVFQRLMTINYMGVVHSVKAVLPSMLQRQCGHISFVSSSMGLLGMLVRAPFC